MEYVNSFGAHSYYVINKQAVEKIQRRAAKIFLNLIKNVYRSCLYTITCLQMAKGTGEMVAMPIPTSYNLLVIQ